MIRLLLADDQALVRAGFRALLNAQDDMQVIGEAADGDEAVRLVARLTPDVVLMDIRMPHCSSSLSERSANRLLGRSVIKSRHDRETEVPTSGL